MSHCSDCHEDHYDKATGTYVACPGCGHEDLERQLADVLTGLVALSPSLANDPRPLTLPDALRVVTSEYVALIQDHASLETELAEAQDALRVRIRGECACLGGECTHLPSDPWVARAVLAERCLAEAQAELSDRQAAAHADGTGHLHRCVKVNGVWQCVAGCAVAERDALKAKLAEARADRDEALTMLKYPYPDTIAAFIRCERERKALRATLEQARETLQHIPYNEYSDALRNGDDPNGAWECFREAARWHLEKGLAALDAGKTPLSG